MNLRCIIDGARFDERDLDSRVLAQSCCENAACGTPTDDKVVISVLHFTSPNPRPASLGLRERALRTLLAHVVSRRRCLRSPSSCSLLLGMTLTMQRAQVWRPGSAVAFKNVPFSICLIVARSQAAAVLRVYLRTAETETPLTSPGAASIRFRAGRAMPNPYEHFVGAKNVHKGYPEILCILCARFCRA